MRHMRRVSFADMNCSIAQALEIIGEWWTPLILRDAFLGVTRFEEFHDRLGISRNILSARLDTLVDAGVMERRTYEEARGRSDYVLTDKGRELWPVLTTLRQWGDKWLLGDDKAPDRARPHLVRFPHHRRTRLQRVRRTPPPLRHPHRRHLDSKRDGWCQAPPVTAEQVPHRDA